MRALAPRFLAAAIIAATLLALAGCFTDGDDVDALSMSETEVERILNANLDAVDGHVPLTEFDRPTLERKGCIPSFPSALPEGPPWAYDVRRWHDGATDAEIDQWRAAVLSLTERGFTAPPTTSAEAAPRATPSDEDPRSISVSDDRGFRVILRVTTPTDGSPVKVEIEASSPCVRPTAEPTRT